MSHQVSGTLSFPHTGWGVPTKAGIGGAAQVQGLGGTDSGGDLLGPPDPQPLANPWVGVLRAGPGQSVVMVTATLILSP